MIKDSTVIGVAKFTESQPISLDIGAGENPKGEVNVDVRPLNKNIDVVCHALHLPFKDRRFSHIYLSHVIEHFSYPDVKKLLNECNRVLKDGGMIEVVTPNFQSFDVLISWIKGKVIKNKNNLWMLPNMLCGDQNYKENVHMSTWTKELLGIYLNNAGFRTILIEGESRFSILKKFPSRCAVIKFVASKNREDAHNY